VQDAIRRSLGNDVLNQYSAELRDAVQHQNSLVWLKDVNLKEARQGLDRTYSVTASASLHLDALKAEITRAPSITVSQTSFINAVLARQQIDLSSRNLTQIQAELAEEKWWENLTNVTHSVVASNWKGEIVDVGSNFITIKIHDNISLSTRIYDAGRVAENALSPTTTPFYNLLPSLNKQDTVIFSGVFQGANTDRGSRLRDRDLCMVFSLADRTYNYRRTYSFLFEFTAMQKQ